MTGQTLSFSAADLAASAAAYDPSLHEAPICVGHPAHDAPAYGWVGRLAFAAGKLEAAPHQVDAAFAELVKAGRFKKISAAFYPPHAAGNPKPGVYYLRHVAFLGAQPPAVKGLKPVQFAGGAEDAVVFADWSDRAVVKLLRGIRDTLIAHFGQDEADKALPSEMLDDLAEDAAQPDLPDDNIDEDTMDQPSFAEQQKQLEQRQREQDERDRALKAREKEIADQQAAFAERARADRRVTLAAAVDALVHAGQAIPAERELLVTFCERLDGGDQITIAFGEDGDPKPVTAAEAFLAWLRVQPPKVAFGEAAPPEVTAAPRRRAGSSFQVPRGSGARVDAADLELRDAALAYAAEHKTDFITAVKILQEAE